MSTPYFFRLPLRWMSNRRRPVVVYTPDLSTLFPYHNSLWSSIQEDTLNVNTPVNPSTYYLQTWSSYVLGTVSTVVFIFLFLSLCNLKKWDESGRFKTVPMITSTDQLSVFCSLCLFTVMDTISLLVLFTIPTSCESVTHK